MTFDQWVEVLKNTHGVRVKFMREDGSGKTGCDNIGDWLAYVGSIETGTIGVLSEEIGECGIWDQGGDWYEFQIEGPVPKSIGAN